MDEALDRAVLVRSFALLGTWGALYAYMSELYPRRRGRRAWASRVRWRGGLLAPSLMTFVVSGGLGLAIGLLAGLLVVAAIAAMAIDAETRQAALS